MQLTQQTLAEQSRQNERLIAHSTQLAEAAQELVTADAHTRDKLLQAHAQLQQTLQAQQSQLDSQRENLEQERRAIAGERVREPMIAQAITAATLSLACLFPLGLAGYMLYCSQQAQAETAAFNELLITCKHRSKTVARVG
jgi:predicted PurR-regulated permease PerM